MGSARTRSLALLIMSTLVLALPATVSGQDGPTRVPVWEEQTIEAPDLGLRNPTGVSFQPRPQRLLIEGRNRSAQKALRKTTLLGGPRTSRSLPADTIDTTYDPVADDLLIVRKATVGPGPAASSSRRIVIERAAGSDIATDLDPAATRDVVVAPDGKVFALEGSRIVRLGSAPGGAMRAVDASAVTIRGSLGTAADAVVIGPDGRHLWVLDRQGRSLDRLTPNGSVDRTIDLAAAGIRSPRGAVFAPSADPTDDAGEMSLYVADGGRSLAGTIVGAGVVELTMVRPVSSSAPSATGSIKLINTVDTSAWKTPSPDPMGITHVGSLKRLVMVDSEVLECRPTCHPVYKGVNLFRLARGGSLKAAFDTTTWNTEPVGIAYDGTSSRSPRYFVVNDSQSEFWQIKAGPDGKFWTSDDRRKVLDTTKWGATDVEGLAYGKGKIFIADGAAKDVIVVDPIDGNFFNGVSVDSFDVEPYGIQDAEGAAFAGDRGTLFVASRKGNTMVEVKPSGKLVSSYSLDSISPDSPSGLAYGPRSTNSSRKSVYITDRGVDNNSDPNENDGKIYEVAIVGSNPSPNPTPKPTNVRLKNGAFWQDENGDGSPDHWKKNRYFSRSDVLSRTGKWAGLHEASGDRNYNVHQDVGGIKPGKVYQFRGWVNAKTGNDAYRFMARIGWKDKDNKTIRGVTIVRYNSQTGGWRGFKANLKAPPGAARARVVMVVRSLNGAIAVDDWSFERRDTAPKPPATVRLRNGGFWKDENGDGSPDHWKKNPFFERSDKLTLKGTWAGRHVAAGNRSYNVHQDVRGIVPGNTYRFRGYVNAKTGNDPYKFMARINWRNSDGKTVRRVTVKRHTDKTRGWKRFNADLIAPPGAVRARVLMVVKSLDGIVGVDQWSFKKVS